MGVVLAAEGFNPLSVEPGLYIWTTIAFLTVLYVLAKKVFPRLEEGLADREAKIKGEIEKAESTKIEAEQVLADYKERVAAAREESSRMLDEARQSAESVRQELVERAEGDARLIVDKARKQLAGERDRILGQLEGQLAEWATAIAGQIIQKELSTESHRELVESFIREIEEQEKATS